MKKKKKKRRGKGEAHNELILKQYQSYCISGNSLNKKAILSETFGFIRLSYLILEGLSVKQIHMLEKSRAQIS